MPYAPNEARSFNDSFKLLKHHVEGASLFAITIILLQFSSESIIASPSQSFVCKHQSTTRLRSRDNSSYAFKACKHKLNCSSQRVDQFSSGLLRTCAPAAELDCCSGRALTWPRVPALQGRAESAPCPLQCRQRATAQRTRSQQLCSIYIVSQFWFYIPRPPSCVHASTKMNPKQDVAARVAHSTVSPNKFS